MVFTKRTQGAFGAMSRKLGCTQTRKPYKALGAAASRCDPSARNFSKSMLSARLARLAQQSFLSYSNVFLRKIAERAERAEPTNLT